MSEKPYCLPVAAARVFSFSGFMSKQKQPPRELSFALGA
jgi:hypothetical protein